jgi:mannose/cellobiose epimerase-like protein (N-acyl-D-glucosamine 2-epimerase family)
MNERPKHRFRGHLREWFRLLVKIGLLTKAEAVAAMLKASFNGVSDEEHDEDDDPA